MVAPKNKLRRKYVSEEFYGKWKVLNAYKSRIKVECQCDKKTIKEVPYKRLLTGVSKNCGCFHISPKKWTTETIQLALDKINFKLLETFNGRITNKHKVRCSAGHDYLHRLDSLIYSNNSCSVCFAKSRITKESIDSFAASKNWRILNTEQYKSEDSILTYQCLECDTKIVKKFSLFRQHNRCSCGGSDIFWVKKLKSLFPNFSFISRKKHVLNVFCNKCKKHQQLYLNDFIVGKHCLCITPNPAPDLFRLFGYTILKSPIIPKGVDKGRVVYEIRCAEGHKSTTTIRTMQGGHVCYKCSIKKLTEPEMELSNFLKKKGLQITQRTRDILSGKKELDIYIPELRVAVEYIGIYWHSLEHFLKVLHYKNKKVTEKEIIKFKYKQQHKLIECAELGITLITIFENDFRYSKKQVLENLEKAIIRNKMETNDLRWCFPLGSISPPRPHYFDKQLLEVTENDPNKKYTVYDCGVSLVSEYQEIA